MADNVYLIDGNRLKEKAVPLLWPTEMEPGGHLPDPVQAVPVSEIEGMLYREGVELVHCGECVKWKPEPHPQCPTLGKCYREKGSYRSSDDFCGNGRRRADHGKD